jgi:FMN phosphatase YigB (HAD superfamily)
VPPAAAIEPIPIEGMVFDFHHTLVDQERPEVWLDQAWEHLKRPGRPCQSLPQTQLDGIHATLDRVWDLARQIDPDNRRDLDPETHRRVFDTVVGAVPGMDEGLTDALYATLPEIWIPYQDALPVLRALRGRGLPIALLSNVGYDIRPILDRTGIGELVAGLALSYELGAVKPDPVIFEHALELIDTRPERALMVGDNFSDDGAAAALGIRTLILPRTRGPVHGLGLTLGLVDT